MDVSGFTHFIDHMLTQYVKKRKGLCEVSLSKLFSFRWVIMIAWGQAAMV